MTSARPTASNENASNNDDGTTPPDKEASNNNDAGGLSDWVAKLIGKLFRWITEQINSVLSNAQIPETLKDLIASALNALLPHE